MLRAGSGDRPTARRACPPCAYTTTVWACVWLFAAVLWSEVAAPATAAGDETPLTAETLKAGLRTVDPDDDAYLTYIAALADQGQIPLALVQSTYLWARQKPYPKRAKYFKQAIILRAAREGITLPTDTPSTTGTIEGLVYAKVLLVSVPIPGATVTIEGTNRRTTADASGRFAFENVPLGTYTLKAKGTLGLVSLSGLARATVPSPPPSTEPTVANILVK